MGVMGWSQQGVIGLRRRRTGLPMMWAEISGCLDAAEAPAASLKRALPGQAASGEPSCRLPWVAITASRARTLVMMACSCRKIAAAMTVWARVGVSGF
jgi:hypothetical protein